jgi:hypothetical protein
MKQSQFFSVTSSLILILICLSFTNCRNKREAEKYFVKNQKEIEILRDFVLTLDSVENINCSWENKYYVRFRSDTAIPKEISEEGKTSIKQCIIHDTLLSRAGLTLDALNAILTKKEKTKFPEVSIPFEDFSWLDTTKILLSLQFKDESSIEFIYSKNVLNKSRFDPEDKTETYLNEHWYAWHPWLMLKK